MGTRSLTFIYDDESRPVINMYRQMDGYPSGHGLDLATFLEPIRMTNGIGGDDQPIANGAGCLAAQVVAHFKGGPGGIYIEPVSSTSCGQDYEYRVKTHGAGAPLTVECYEVGGGYEGKRLYRKRLFEGNVADFKTFCMKED